MSGTSAYALMERAGHTVAEAVRRLGNGAPVLVLCGPGNNGGDGYVVATALARHGIATRVTASAEPMTDAACEARRGWQGPVEALRAATPAPVLVDALFGTGLSRPLAGDVSDALAQLTRAAGLSIAVDVPSGVGTDDGALLGLTSPFDLTLALGAAKPAHVLQPSAQYCGLVRILDIGIAVASKAQVLRRPAMSPPPTGAHKYTRGMVAIVAGTMPGASELAAVAALRAGAGYALLLGEGDHNAPHAIVRAPWRPDALADPRINVVLIGPGLGRDGEAARRLDAAIHIDRALVIDGDALHLLDTDRLSRVARRSAPTILTPHAGEFAALFGKTGGSKAVAAQCAAQQSGAYVVFKGADTVIAAPDGRLCFAECASSWLSTAGTGDVLAGAISAMVAGDRGDMMEQIGAGVWLHAEAARLLGSAFIADDLAASLSRARDIL